MTTATLSDHARPPLVCCRDERCWYGDRRDAVPPPPPGGRDAPCCPACGAALARLLTEVERVAIRRRRREYLRHASEADDDPVRS